MSSVVAPLLHWKVYGTVPPLAVRSIEPLLPEKQDIFAVTVVLADKDAAGWLIFTDWVFVQPLSSVMVTVYVPLERPLMYSVVEPVFHK